MYQRDFDGLVIITQLLMAFGMEPYWSGERSWLPLLINGFFLGILLLLRLRPKALGVGLRLTNKIRLSPPVIRVGFITRGSIYFQ